MAGGVTPDRPEAARLSGRIGRIPRSLDPSTLLCCALCTATFGYWSWGATGRLDAVGLAFLAALPPTLFLLGRGLLRLIRFPNSPDHAFPVAFLVGALAASILLLFLNLASPLSMRANAALVLVAAALLQVRRPGAGDPGGGAPGRWRPPLVVVLALAASTLWTQDLRPYAFREGESIRFRPYVDSLAHAELIGQFRADRSIRSMGDPDLAGQRLPFYHYASYTLPACVSTWTGQSAFEGVLTFWIPFGFLLLGLAAYALGSGLWGRPAGIAAFVGVLLMPDSASYGVRCDWYSFHWLCAISPGLLYGIAAGAIVALLVAKGVRPTRWGWIASGAGLAFLSVLLKAQVFVIEAPVLVLWFLLFKEGWSNPRRFAVGLPVLGVGCLAIVVADVLKVGPLFLLLSREHGIEEYFQSLAGEVPGDAWGGYFAPLAGRRPIERYPLRALLLVLMAPFGALLPAYFASMAASKFLRRLRPEDAIPMFTLAFYLYLVFWTPRNNRGAPDELWHRPFVWVYFLLAVWTWGKSASLLSGPGSEMPRPLRYAPAVAAVALLAVPWHLGEHVQRSGRLKPSDLTEFVVPPDLLACAEFLRTHSGRMDVVQNGVPDPRMKPPIPEPILGGFAERRSYLGRPLKMWTGFSVGTPGVAESLRREKVLEGLRKSGSPAELADHVRRTGIRWYVAHPSEDLRWPPEVLDRPAFASGRYRVYDLGPVGR